MRVFRNLRELIWPLLEKSKKQEPILIDECKISIESNQLDGALKQAMDYYNTENERNRIVEGKSSIFIGTMSVAISVVLGVTSILFNSRDFDNNTLLLISFLFILILYLSRTLWFSIKVLEREGFHIIEIDDFLFKASNEDYNKRLIADITNKTRKNSIIVNKKVSNMAMAQEYFKRAIVIIPIYSIILLISFITKSKIRIFDIISTSINSINISQITNWTLVVLYSLVLISIVLSIIVLNKLKNKK
jgi:hypothetical protein